MVNYQPFNGVENEIEQCFVNKLLTGLNNIVTYDLGSIMLFLLVYVTWRGEMTLQMFT